MEKIITYKLGSNEITDLLSHLQESGFYKRTGTLSRNDNYTIFSADTTFGRVPVATVTKKDSFYELETNMPSLEKSIDIHFRDEVDPVSGNHVMPGIKD